MITYSNMTLKRCYDLVMLKATSHRTPENLDWGTVVKYINRAWKEVLIKTLPYKDWAYKLTTTITHGGLLPVSYLKGIRVLVSPTGNPPFTEARYVDAREYFTLSNWQRKQQWNACTVQNPIYTLWGHLPVAPNTDNQAEVSIFLAPNTDHQTGVAPAGFSYETNNMAGIMEYYGIPIDLTTDGDILPVPYEFENLVVLLTLIRVFSKTADTNLMQSLQQQIGAETQKLLELYTEFKVNTKRELDSFVEPVPPFAPGVQDKGEIPNNLTGKK
jgi:hypothetical protein